MRAKINIDVLTLDSVQCAACGYMMESIAALPQTLRHLGFHADLSEECFELVDHFNSDFVCVATPDHLASERGTTPSR